MYGISGAAFSGSRELVFAYSTRLWLLHRWLGREANASRKPSDHRPSLNVSGSAVSNRDPPAGDFVPKKISKKTESDLTRSSPQRLGGTKPGFGALALR